MKRSFILFKKIVLIIGAVDIWIQPDSQCEIASQTTNDSAPGLRYSNVIHLLLE